MKITMIHERDEKGRFKKGISSSKKGLSYDAIYGHKKAENIRLKLSVAHKGQKSGMEGKTHTAKIRERISQNTSRCWNDGIYSRDKKQPNKWECIKCEYCEKEFEAQKCMKRKYCSPACAYKGIDRKGSNGGNWRGGTSSEINIRIGSNFWKKLSKNIRRRDNHTCQLCGKQQWNLDVHHIIPERLGGPSEDWNLITLCRSCHSSIDIKHGGVCL